MNCSRCGIEISPGAALCRPCRDRERYLSVCQTMRRADERLLQEVEASSQSEVARKRDVSRQRVSRMIQAAKARIEWLDSQPEGSKT